MHIYVYMYIYIQMQYFILHDLEIITRKTSRTCAAQVKFIKHCKAWKHHVQSQRGSHLAVQLPDCRSAAVWRSSQSGLRGRNSALGFSQALRRWWNKVDLTRRSPSLGIQLPPMRKKILGAIKRKLIGSRTVRFGEVLKFEPILNQKPRFSKCPWVDLDEIEVRNDKVTLQAAITTWRFCATGLDGQEETSLMENAFNVKGIVH